MATRPLSTPFAPKKDEPQGLIARASIFLGYFRWLYMPIALFALIAIGVHAAADTVDDRIRFLVEQADAFFDYLFGTFEATQRFVDAVGPEERTVIARALTLIWELAADVFIAFPAFGYLEEETTPVQFKHLRVRPTRGFRELFRAVVKEPTTMRIFRPLCTAALVLAGACAVGRTVQSASFLTLDKTLSSGMAGSLARLFAVAAIVAMLASFGVRAVLRNLQHADEVAQKDRARSRALRISRGLLGTVVVLPLAAAAFLDATPLLSFFR